jgi:tetratricopeptide (TPR) repeat protein
MFSSRLIYGPVFVFVLGTLTGCGKSADEDLLRSAQVTFDDALAREASGDFAGALPLIDAALVNGGLNPDQLADGYLLRARCYCASGDLEKAQADIETADQGAPNPAMLHLTRGMLLDKQGKSAEAKAEFTKAKKADPMITLP